jgi:hypothetical protein
MPNFNISLPDLSTIVTVLSVLAVPVVTLIGVAITQSNNRKTKRLELEHNRELKEMELDHQSELRHLELRQQASRLVRAERRAVYLEMLRNLASPWHFWMDLREYGIEDNYVERSREVQAYITSYAALLPELQLCGSAEVRRKSRELLAGFTECLEALADTAEEEVTEFDDDEKVEAQWQKALNSALQVYDEQRIDKKYRELISQIRDEMSDLALEVDSVGTD